MTISKANAKIRADKKVERYDAKIAEEKRRAAMGEMNERQRQFCLEFLNPENKFSIAAAYIAAGYSYKSASTNAHELYNKPQIQAEIMRLKSKRSRGQEVTMSRVVEDLLRIARKAEKACAYAPATRALELVGKHIGMFHEKIDMEINYDAKGDTPEIDREIERLLKILPKPNGKETSHDNSETETTH